MTVEGDEKIPKFVRIRSAQVRESKPTNPFKRLLIFVFVLALFVPFAARGWSILYKRWLELGKPSIEILGEPIRGIGVASVTLKFSASDNESGLRDIKVSGIQGTDVSEILVDNPNGQNQKTIELRLVGSKIFKREGTAQIEITARDRSYFRNLARVKFDVPVDFRKPSLEILAGPSSSAVGGSQIVIFSVNDLALVRTGVLVDSAFYDAFPAGYLDEELSQRSDIYAAIFPLPRANFAPKVRLIAEDSAGNSTSQILDFKIAPLKSTIIRENLEPDFLSNQIAQLFETHENELKSLARKVGTKLTLRSESNTISRRLEELHLIVTKLIPLYEAQLGSMLKGNKHGINPGRLLFEKPASGPVIDSYGSRLELAFKDRLAGSLELKGVIIQSKSGSAVTSASSGVVIFSGSLGQYGQCVIIEHGKTVSSLYGYLSSRTVHEGQKVEKGDIVGRTGSSGLYPKPGLMFEIRVQGTAVNPRQWWDRAWTNAQLDGKIKAVKNALGLKARVPFAPN